MATIARMSQDEAARLRKRYRNAERLRLTLVYAILSVIAIAMVYPYIFTIGNALKPLGQFMASPWTVWPRHPSLNGFLASWSVGKVQWFIWNSFLYLGVLAGQGASRSPLDAGILSAEMCLMARDSCRTGSFQEATTPSFS